MEKRHLLAMKKEQEQVGLVATDRHVREASFLEAWAMAA